MAELIDREAVLDELKAQLRKCPLSFAWGLDCAINVVLHAPAVAAVEAIPADFEPVGPRGCPSGEPGADFHDVVEVVRCGSPCYWLYDGPVDYCCTNHKGLVKITPDSFCSYGKRREENAAD